MSIKYGDIFSVSLLNINKKYYGEILEFQWKNTISLDIKPEFSVSGPTTITDINLIQVSCSLGINFSTSSKADMFIGDSRIKMLFDEGVHYKKLFGHLSTPKDTLVSFKDGIHWNHIVYPYRHKAIRITASLEINQAFEVKSAIPPYGEYLERFVPVSGILHGKSNVFVSAFTLEGSGRRYQLALDQGLLFKHLVGNKKSGFCVDQGSLNKTILTKFANTHQISASLSLLQEFNAVAETKSSIPEESTSSNLEIDLSLSAKADHYSYYYAQPVFYFKNGVLYKHLSGSPSQKQSIFLDKSTLYKHISPLIKELGLNLVNLSGKAKFVSGGQSVAAIPTIHSASASIEVSFGLGALPSWRLVHSARASMEISLGCTALATKPYIHAASGSVEAVSQAVSTGPSLHTAYRISANLEVSSVLKSKVVKQNKATSSLSLLFIPMNHNASIIRQRASLGISLSYDISSIYTQSSLSTRLETRAKATYQHRLSASMEASFGGGAFCWLAKNGRMSVTSSLEIKCVVSGLRIVAIYNSSKPKLTIRPKLEADLKRVGRLSAEAKFISGGRVRIPPVYTLRCWASARFIFDAGAKGTTEYYLFARGVYNTLRWNRSAYARYYEIYMSDFPGKEYELIKDRVLQMDKPEFSIPVDMVPQNFEATNIGNGVKLTWDSPQYIGAPMTFKVVPIREDYTRDYEPEADNVWTGDDIPVSAIWVDQSGLTISDHRRHDYNSWKISATNGLVEPGFIDAPEITGGYFVVWAYIDFEEVPDCIWVALYNGISWDKRVYWSKNKCPYGFIGEHSRRYLEEIPTSGAWVPLIISLKNLEASKVMGLKFGVFKEEGTGTIYIDSICYTPQVVRRIDPPYLTLRREDAYCIYRNDKKIAYTDNLEYNDYGAVDTGGFQGGAPTYTFRYDPINGVKISWGTPEGNGTEYTYKLASVNSNGEESSFLEQTITVSTSYAKTEINISSSSTPEFMVTVNGPASHYYHTDAVPGEIYTYVFTAYSSIGEVISKVTKKYQVPLDHVLDYFILDKSLLV